MTPREMGRLLSRALLLPRQVYQHQRHKNEDIGFSLLISIYEMLDPVLVVESVNE